jgi:hypothetical protein
MKMFSFKENPAMSGIEVVIVGLKTLVLFTQPIYLDSKL